MDIEINDDFIKRYTLRLVWRISQTLAKIKDFDFPEPEPIAEVDSNGNHEKN